MRPLKLSLVAFGPYAGAQIFDFSELSGNNLFLITGNTGSGKTTMFDAMSVALFGESSAGQSGRLARDLRSDFAKGDILTEVTFDFSLGNGKIYRAYYAPEQERRKKKGDGLVKISASASLHAISTSGEPELLAEGVRLTKERIEGLLGLDSHQFRQVVMLAQGQFRGLLEADSQSRERIFETLFGTHYYAQIEKKLKERAAEIQSLHREAQGKLQTILEGTEYKTLQDLTGGINVLHNEVTELRQQEQQAEKVYLSAQNDFEARKSGNEKLRELDESQEALKLLQDQAASYSLKKDALQRAELAANISPYYNARNTRKIEVTQAEKRLAENRMALDRVKIDQASAADDLKKIHTKQAEFEEKKRQRQALEGKRSKLEEYLQWSHDLKAAEIQQEKSHKKYHKAKMELDTLKQALRDARKQLLALRKNDQDLGAIEAAGKEVRVLIDTHNEIRTIESEIQNNASAVNLAAQAVETQKVEIQNCKQRKKELFAFWLEGQAARIAETLQSGDPCPVCGSINHPDPKRHGGKNVTDEQLIDVDEQIARAEELLETKKAELAELQDGQNQRFTRKETLEKILGNEKNISLDLLMQQREDLKQNYQTVNRNKQAIDILEQQITSQEKIEEGRQTVLESEQGAWQRAESDVTRLIAVVAGLKQDVEEPYRQPGILIEEIKKLATQIEDFESEKKQAEEKYQITSETFTEINEKVRGATEELSRCKIAFDKSSNDYISRLATSPFADEGLFLAAILSADQVAELKNTIETYFTALAMADDRHKKAVSGAKGVSFTHLDELQITLNAFNKELNQRKEGRIALQTTLQAKERELARAEQEQKAIDRLDSKYQSLGRIADVANGNNNKRTSFHRFILQSLLDEVLEIASYRLKKMTNQKFYLSRDDGLRDARKQSGLELILTDTFTGTQRSVKSLSGGEGFLAALSLALGLSEVVQAHAGGIRLDTIFIDEGFGSLDPGSLDQVIDVLNSLSGEGRLVGIISHVPELKQQIYAQLQVEEGLSGSTACFRV